MKNLNYLMAFAVLFTFSNPAEAFLCGKKCQARKAKAKEHLENGGNCTDLKGGTKRKCKRQARKIAREEAREKCKGRGAACRRTIRRDAKGRMGAYGFIGSKKANAQSKDNWELYNKRKVELDQLLASNQISQDQYVQFLKEAESMRKKESNRIGRVKTIKTVAAAGIAAAAVVTGGAAAAVGAAGFGMAGAGMAASMVGTSAAVGGTALAGAGTLAAASASNGYGSRATQQINYNRQLVAAQQANVAQQQNLQFQQSSLPGMNMGGRGPASIGGACASLAPGSCERRKCNCNIGFQKGVAGQPVHHVTNRNGEETIRHLCSQKVENGLQAAWLHAVSQRPEIGQGCM